MSIILSPISLMASSQLIRRHSPLTSFIGYFSRRSPWACSRTDAPFAQWAPRLNGLSQPGSCPTHTPFATSATTVQPTEQWVQTDFFSSTFPTTAPVAASAFFIMPGAVAMAAAPPAARPERLINVRRSMAPPVIPARARDKRGPFATPFVFLVNIDLLSLSCDDINGPNAHCAS